MKLNIRMTSLVLILVLALSVFGGAVRAESSETEISGTLRTSDLAEGAALLLIGDTTLVLDAPKTLTSIRGEYKLSLRGSQALTVHNPVGDAIQVDSLLIRGNVSVIGEFGLHANGNISIEEGPVKAEASSDGVCSENGAVTIIGSTEITAGAYGVYAAQDVSLNGNVRSTAAVAVCSEFGEVRTSGEVHAIGSDYGMYGYEGVRITDGKVEAVGTRHDAIRAQTAAVSLAGTVSAKGGENGVYACDVTQEGSVEAVGESGDGIRAMGTIHTGGKVVAKGGDFGLYAQEALSTEGGSIDAEGEKHDGIRVNAGGIQINADVKAKGATCGIFSRGDLSITGKIDATGLQGSGVYSEASALLSGELNIRGREYGVCARADAALSGSGSVSGSSNDGVRAHTGEVTLSGELTVSGLYGVFGGGGVAMTGGTLSATGSRACAVASEFGAVRLEGTVKAVGADYGVYAYTDLELSGSVEAEGSQHDGIHAHTGTVTIAGDVTAKGTMHCIFGGGGVAIRSGVVVTGDAASAGVYSEYGAVYISGELLTSGIDYGVYAYTDVTIENAGVKAVGEQHDGIRAQTGIVQIAGNVEAKGEMYGIYACSGLEMLRGTVITVGTQHNGIYSIDGWVSIAGDVTATGGDYGIYAFTDVTISRGTVIATGKTQTGIVADDGTMKISGHVTATGGHYGIYCDKIFQLEGGSVIASGGKYDGINVRNGPAEFSGDTSIYGYFYGIMADEIKILGGNLDVTGGSSSFFFRHEQFSMDSSLDLTQPAGAEVGSVTILGPDLRDATRVVISDPNSPRNPFTDVPENSYYYDAVNWAVNTDPQITTGTTPTTFSPDATCTRAQAVTFLWRTRGCPKPTITQCQFVDVLPGTYYYEAVLWAVEQGITIGTSATTFSPHMGCTRAHVVTFLHREQHEPAPVNSYNPFVDVAADVYYYYPVLWAVERSITKGTTATSFSPHSTCTRAQIVTFLYRDMIYASR